MASEPTPDAAPAARPRRSLDGRTLAICACIALIVAIGAGIVATVVLSGDDGGSDTSSDRLTLSSTDINADQLLAARLTTIDDEPTSLDELMDGRPVLVNLWQQACVPCIKEMPLLEQASQDNPGVDVLGIDVQDRLDHATAMVEQTGITYPWVQDVPGLFLAEAKAPYLPTTLLVSAEGEVLAVRTGEFKTLADVQSFLDDHLG